MLSTTKGFPVGPKRRPIRDPQEKEPKFPVGPKRRAIRDPQEKAQGLSAPPNIEVRIQTSSQKVIRRRLTPKINYTHFDLTVIKSLAAHSGI